METESEWDDDERTRMLALRKYERDICECGFPISLTSDRSNVFQIEHRRCLVCARSEQYGRIQHDSDDKASTNPNGEQLPPGAPRPSDGRYTYLRLTALNEAHVGTKPQRGGDRGN